MRDYITRVDLPQSQTRRAVCGFWVPFFKDIPKDWTSGRIYLSEPLEKLRELQKRPMPDASPRDGLEPCYVGCASSTALQPLAAK
jgi:hypothetical protein